MDHHQPLKPVRFAGTFCIIITLLGLIFQSYALPKSDFDISFKYIVAIVSAFHLLVGFGVLSQKIWGYYLMKIYLYIILLGVPIGTLLSLKALNYLRENEVKQYYL